MKQIIILATSNCNLGSVDNPRRAFLSVNQYLAEKKLEPLFNVQIAGESNEIKVANGTYTIHTDLQLKDVQQADLIIIPALEGDISKALQLNANLIPMAPFYFLLLYTLISLIFSFSCSECLVAEEINIS